MSPHMRSSAPERTRVHGASEGKLTLPSFFIGLPTFAFVSGCLGLAVEDLGWEILTVSTLSAAFSASDLIDALRSRRDLLSPRALLSLPLLIGVYIAPLMHITLGVYPEDLVLPSSMTDALFNLSIVQLCGVVLYFFTIRVTSAIQRKRATPPGGSESKSFVKRLRRWMTILGWASLLVFLYMVLNSGGPAAWLDSQINYRTSLGTPGWLLALGEAFPTLFFISYTLSLRERNLTPSQLRWRLFLAIAIFVAITFLSSGLRGSRANLVWPLVSALLVIHLIYFRIRAKWLVTTGVIVLTFAGLYDVYKKTGAEALSDYGLDAIESTNEQRGSDFGLESLILGDFSRTATQAVLLDRWNNSQFDLNWGATYVGNALEFVPGAESIDTFPNKREAATEVLYQRGFVATDFVSSRIYGIQGEGMINFGPFLGAILIFIPFSFIVVASESLFGRSRSEGSVVDSLLIALLTPCVILLFVSDLDNVLKTFTTNAMLPIAVIGSTMAFARSDT